MKSKARLLASALLLVLLLLACAPKAAPAAQSPAPAAAPMPAPVSAAPLPKSKQAWEVEWEKTVEAAKKEGRLMLYTSLGGEPRQMITSAFESKYGVRIESVTGRAIELIPKIRAEQRAGIYSGDVSLSGAAAVFDSKGLLDRIESVLILPELTEPELIKKTWYFGELSWPDNDHTGLIGLMDVKEPVIINTNLVNASEITAYRDLLNPKWKGKISIYDPQVSGGGQIWFASVLELGDVDVNYMRELLTKQELFITRDSRLHVDWLAKGKHSIAIGPVAPIVTEFIRAGAPVERVRLGTVYSTGGTSAISLMKGAPHPNAAKLYTNWELSKEGQTIHSQAEGSQSQRLDVTTAHLNPFKRLEPGLKAYRTDNEQFNTKRTTVYASLAKEIFGPLTK